MDVYINDNKIEYSLNKEENLSQLINEFSLELDRMNFLISSDLEVDEKKIPLGDQCLKKIKIEDVKNLKFKILSKLENYFNKYDLFYNYLNIIRNSILEFQEKKTESSEKNLKENLSNLIELRCGLNNLFKDDAELDIKILNSLTEDDLKNLKLDSKEFLEEFRIEMENAVRLINARMQELSNPEDKFNETINNLINSNKFQEIPILFQSNEISIANKEVFSISLEFSKLLRLCKYNIWNGKENPSLEKNMTELKELIKDLSKAFEDNDIILICDLLEYEIKTIIEEISQIL